MDQAKIRRPQGSSLGRHGVLRKSVPAEGLLLSLAQYELLLVVGPDHIVEGLDCCVLLHREVVFLYDKVPLDVEFLRSFLDADERVRGEIALGLLRLGACLDRQALWDDNDNVIELPEGVGEVYGIPALSMAERILLGAEKRRGREKHVISRQGDKAWNGDIVFDDKRRVIIIDVVKVFHHDACSQG